MKRLVFVIIIFCSLEANAQIHLISFAGTGESTFVGSAEVENLTSGTSLTVNGTDVLRLTSTVGIYDVDNENSSRMKIYPNPMTDKSTLMFSAPVEGDAIISVCDITGKIVTQIKSYVENYTQEFILSGLKNGIYFINVKGNTYQFSGKLISNGKSNGTISIEKVSGHIAVDSKASIDAKGVQATVDMDYTTGDRLKFKGISGIYSTVMIDIPAEDKTITFNFIACTDGDNINYPVVEIGTQVWMAENLKTTKYRNGDLIGTTVPATLDISGESMPKYQWAYDGNENNVATYGRLYTWDALSDSRNACPTGWHVFTDPELVILVNYLANNGYSYSGIGFDVAKSMAAASGWTTDPTAGNVGNDQASNNSTGFTALPGGSRDYYGTFGYIGSNCYFWSSTEYSSHAVYPYIFTGYSGVGRSDTDKVNGFSVRCLRD